MLKKADARGQILLGQQYAGQRFDVVAHSDGRVELTPLASSVAAELSKIVHPPDGWAPPGGYDGCTQWELDNRDALEAYARQVEEEGTAAEQLQHYLATYPEHG